MTNFNDKAVSTSSKRKAMFSVVAMTSFIFFLPAQAQIFDIDGFTGIKAEAGVNVVYARADHYLVKAEFENEVISTLRIHRRGKTLHIARQTKNGWADGGARVTVNVQGPTLSFIEASSGARVNATGLESGQLKVRTSSGGRLSASGTCQRLNIKSESGGISDLSSMQCNQVVAKAYSGGVLKVYAESKIKARSNSGGIVRILGAPDLRDIRNANGAYGGKILMIP